MSATLHKLGVIPSNSARLRELAERMDAGDIEGVHFVAYQTCGCIEFGVVGGDELRAHSLLGGIEVAGGVLLRQVIEAADVVDASVE